MKPGFTLIELLVVVAILGILASVGMGQFFTAQKRGRDTQRKESLASVARALEMYYNDHKQYPPSPLPWGGEFKDAKGTVYMKQLPKDPADNFQYYYQQGPGGTSFKLYAFLEHSEDPDIKREETGEPSYYEGTSCGGARCNYCLASANASCD